ncbi:MAG: HEAT repeat domain-containing protein [Planctomycetota bacterium]
MTRSALLLPLLLLLPLVVSAQAFDFDEAKKEFNRAFRPAKPAKDHEEAVASVAMFETREAAKLLVSAVQKVQTLLAPLYEEKAKVDKQLGRYRKGKTFDHPEQIDPKAGASIRSLRKKSAKLQNQIDGELKVFEAIEEGLATMRGGTALAYLQRTALFEGYWRARQIVAAALGEMRDPSSVEFLVRALRDKDDRVVTAAATSLGKLDDPKVLKPLLDLLGHKSWEVRSAAIWSLGELGEKGAVGPLIEQIEKEEGRLREDCAKALERLTGQKFGQSVDLWRKWWEEHKHEYGGDGKPLGGHDTDDDGDPGRGYYGIPIRTNKAIFILDVSGSMSKSMKDPHRDPEQGELSKIDAAKKELTRVLKTFDPKGWFNLIFFNDAVKVWKQKMVQAKDSAKREATAFVKSLNAASSTNIYDALQEAFKIAGLGSRDKHYTLAADTIFLLSDGSPTKPDGSADDWMKIIRAVREWNKLKRVKIHTIGVGGHNASFMSMLARENDGKYVSR